MQVNNNNNMSFGAVRLPKYQKLSKDAQAVVTEIDTRFRPNGVFLKAMFFKDPAHEVEARKMLDDANIPYAHAEDSVLTTQDLRNFFATQIDVII